MFDLRGFYSPLTITPTLFMALSKEQQTAWTKVQDAQQRWSITNDSLPLMEADADAAPRADEAAAIHAVREGKPIPKPTADAAKAAVTAKRREIEALACIADEMEHAFLAGVTDTKATIAADARTTCEALGQQAQEQITALTGTLDMLADALGLWRWARGSDPAPLPSPSRMRVRFNGQDHGVSELVTAAGTLLAKVLPSGVERTENEWSVYNASLTGRPVTPDGLVIDAAARREWNR